MPTGLEPVGVCFEVGIDCPSCETMVPVNALVSRVACPACGAGLELGTDEWETIAADVLTEAPGWEEGEGSNSTVFGSLRYRITRGRLLPRYHGTSETIPRPALEEALESGSARHPETGEETSVRPVPDGYRGLLPGAVALVDEDPSLVAESIGEEGDGTIDPGEGSSPVAFTCPSCGAYLVADSRTRSAGCDHCGQTVSMPDDLWLRLHPAVRRRRWYVLFDMHLAPLRWRGDVWDAAADGEGRLLVCLEGELDAGVLACVGPDGLQAWRRDDLELVEGAGDRLPRLVSLPDREVAVINPACADAEVLSTEDGTAVRSIRGDDFDDLEGSRETFSGLGCIDACGMPDGSIVILRDPGLVRDGSFVMQLLRFDGAGSALPMWPGEEGFLARLGGLLRRRPARVEDGRSRPEETTGRYCRVGPAADGGLLLLENESLMRYSPGGERLYRVELPCDYTEGRPLGLPDGSTALVARGGEMEVSVLRVSPDGSGVEMLDGSDDDESDLCLPQALTGTPDGRLHVFGWDGRWHVVEAAPS